MDAAAPVPVRDSVLVVGAALLVTVRVPFAVPEVVGLNVIVNDTLVPAAMVTGSDSPPILKTELLVVAAVTVTLAPLAVNCPVAEPLFPTVTLPRFSVEGEMLSVPTADVPVPERETVRVGFEALDEIVTLPFAIPVVAGANLTVNVVLCPAFNVSGVVIPLSV